MTFEYDSAVHHWVEPVLDLEVKDQMVSFRTPSFPYSIDSCTTVNVVLKQRTRILEPLQFVYITIGNKKNNIISIVPNTFFSCCRKMSTMSKKCDKQTKSIYTN